LKFEISDLKRPAGKPAGLVMALANPPDACDNPRMPVEKVNLSDQQVQFIREGVDAGRYADVSEVIHAGLRLLQRQEEREKRKLHALRRIANDSFEQIERGEYEIVGLDNLDEFMDRMDAESRTAQ
jgi:putative addiction module CopG family antidote